MSKAKYIIGNLDKCIAIVWETDMGLVTVVQNNVDMNGNISLHDAKTGATVDSIDLRDLLVSLLPNKGE